MRWVFVAVRKSKGWRPFQPDGAINWRLSLGLRTLCAQTRRGIVQFAICRAETEFANRSCPALPCPTLGYACPRCGVLRKQSGDCRRQKAHEGIAVFQKLEFLPGRRNLERVALGVPQNENAARDEHLRGVGIIQQFLRERSGT